MAGRQGVSAPRLLQAVGAGSVLYGVLLMTVPRAAARAVGGAAPPSWLVRLLGARQIAQGAVLLVRPAVPTVAASATVDGLHALSMVAAVVRAPAHRRAAAASGGVALTSGLLAAVSIA
jgi:hypothetical protein